MLSKLYLDSTSTIEISLANTEDSLVPHNALVTAIRAATTTRAQRHNIHRSLHHILSEFSILSIEENFFVQSIERAGEWSLTTEQKDALNSCINGTCRDPLDLLFYKVGQLRLVVAFMVAKTAHSDVTLHIKALPLAAQQQLAKNVAQNPLPDKLEMLIRKFQDTKSASQFSHLPENRKRSPNELKWQPQYNTPVKRVYNSGKSKGQKAHPLTSSSQGDTYTISSLLNPESCSVSSEYADFAKFQGLDAGSKDLAMLLCAMGEGDIPKLVFDRATRPRKFFSGADIQMSASLSPYDDVLKLERARDHLIAVGFISNNDKSEFHRLHPQVRSYVTICSTNEREKAELNALKLAFHVFPTDSDIDEL
jgi:hypothetical protein